MLAEHKRARFDYEILEEYEAGIELLGLEVKSLRAHGAVLDGSHVTIRGGEAYIMQMAIPPYQPANTPQEYDPLRVRRLLLTKAQIADLAALEAGRGLTIVPLKVYNKGKKVKVAIAVVRGKKKFDKRETIKERESDREIRRTLKKE
ncbi:MAG TPA: SsrA-binding protein SmpB [Candidatus Paceibacterota bacterium]|nr:SsrA-binding protein SmpB [Candidatus Paceibacterota bacterium]